MAVQIKEDLAEFPLIVLAAGRSSRMGAPKGLLPYNGTPWLMEQIRRFRRAGGERVVAVLGEDALDYVGEMPWLERHALVEVNPTPERGSFSSLKCGIQRVLNLDGEVKGAFILPVDVPAPEPLVWQRVATGLGPRRASMPVYNGKGGHPVLLSRRFLMQLLDLESHSPLARLDLQLQELSSEQVRKVKVEDAQVMMNLNTPDEWERFLMRPRAVHPGA